MIDEPRPDLKGVARGKEEALVRLELQQPVRARDMTYPQRHNTIDQKDSFEVHKFFRGGLGELPCRPEPTAVILEAQRAIQAVHYLLVFAVDAASRY